MAQKTDLNVAPYYDDFDSTDNFHKVLFRPGFAVQARELTQLQSILQNQIEKHGNNIFKDGTVVVPGQMSFSNYYDSIQLASTFGSEDVVPAQYYNAVTPTIITGATSGVQAEVIGFKAGTSTTQPTLYLKYIKTGSDFVTATFSDSENISANASIVHTTAYASNIASATTHTTAAQVGSAAKVESGIYYVRGQFVRVAEQTLVISDNSTTVSKRIGFTVTETLVTPETDTTLTDNATGSSNYAAKGAHRLKIELTLTSLETSSIADATFIETMRVENGRVVNAARNTEYSVLGDTLARRTFDESGDYTVRPFQFDVRETVDSTVANIDFDGVYASGATTDDGNTASNDLLTLAITPGKAYVKGYEIEKIATTYKDITKPRDTQTVNAGISVFETGNFVKVTNVYGTPDITSIAGETTPYNTLGLFSLGTTTRGAASGKQVGVARARTMQYESGDANATDAIFRLYLFDIRPFTYITLSDTPSPTLIASHSNGGVQMTGVTSGATGFVHGALTTGTQLVLTNIVGTFSSGEKLTASDSAETGLIIENAANADLTISSIISHTFADVRQIFMNDADAGQDFTADCVLEFLGDTGQIVLNGTDASSTNANDNIVLEEDNSTTLSREVVKEAKVKSPEKNQSLFKLPKKVINTLLTDDNDNASDSQITVRRQFIGTTNASGVVAFTAGSNETFVAHAEKDYTLSVLTAGDGSAAQGEIVSIADTMAGNGTATLTITDDTKFGDSAKVKLIATLLKTSVASKVKTTNLVKQLKVDVGATHAFGTRPTDTSISLGRTDVFKLVGVFDSEDTSADATAPELTLGTITGTFTRGELITGSSSGAKARIIDTTSPMSYALTKGFGATDFTTADTITGDSSGATSTVTALTAGSKVITNYFTLDTGQRDNYYDIARIERKPGFNAPRGRLLVIYDYFSHSAGSYFSVDSYSDVAGRMGYDDIPVYSATKVDPDDQEPSGEFPLADCFDFRPSVEDIAGASTIVTNIDEITGNSFDFFSRQYDGSGATVVDSPQPDSNLQADFEFFLGKFASVFLTATGIVKVIEGISAEEPVEPKDIDNAMKLATLFLPPFTFTPENVSIKRYKTQRFTMRDIGRLQSRIQNVEYYTALSLLERDAESFEIQDANGLNRFKSGFIVDNFGGHRVGNTVDKDYKCAIDMQEHELRPKCVMRSATLAEQATTDTARLTANYQKTGDLYTLPYTNKVMAENSFATTVENVQPFLRFSWVGIINLSPSGDEWFETEVAPALIVNVEGNFNAVLAANSNRIGTVWNAWETQWSGVVSTERVREWRRNHGHGSLGFAEILETTRSELTRTGLRSQVVERIDEESQGSRVISKALIPFVRPRNVTIEGFGFKPNTRLYAFFDKKDVNPYVTPSDAVYTSDTTIAAASPLITTDSGKIECTFAIPEHRFAGQESVPKFQTGEVEFRLTSSTTDDRSKDPITAGQAIYHAVGILETEQETIIATRNGTFFQDQVNQSETRETTRTFTESTGYSDPLAQTFLCDEEDGSFITKVDLYFASKDENLPINVQIRNVVNGYPGKKILAFGQKTLEPSEVNVSSDATSATTFTFDSPIYLKEGQEYCIVAMTQSLNYKMWISELGQLDVGGSRTVSEQPFLGVLFKSQNNSTWNAVQSQDMKFTLYKADFTIGSGTLTLTNDNIGDEVTAEDGTTTVYARRLLSNPIVLSTTSTACQVKHKDHGMYATANNVKITGVKSEISTTLNGAITAAATSLTLTSGTGFVASNRSSRCYVKINNEIMFGTISGTGLSSITRGDDSTTAVAHATGSTVELYQILGTPLDEINKTHTAIANIQLDSYTVLLSNAPTITGATTIAEVGGIGVYASENYRYETIKTLIGAMELPDTTLSAKIRTTTGTSPSGAESSFSTLSTGVAFPLNENFNFDTTRIVASSVNETNELSAAKSLFIPITLSTTKSNVSPVIDLGRKSMICIGNVLNNIDSSSDVYPTSDYVPSTEPEGDQNAFIYITKRVALENPATALKIFFAANKHSSSDIKLLFKILRSDSSDDFNDLGYEFFNTTGTTDIITPSSLDSEDLQQYVYTAGVTDDGIGTPLPEFIQFAIKIVGQGTNAAQPPRIRDLRVIALAT